MAGKRSQKERQTKPRTSADGIDVWCRFDEMVRTGDIEPNPANPNTHPQEQIDRLAKIIKTQGWRNPVTVSRRSGLIVKGHARYVAGVALGCGSVPVEYQDYKNDESETADLLADNKIAELAIFDESAAEKLLEKLLATNFDIELTGFDPEAEIFPADVSGDGQVFDVAEKIDAEKEYQEKADSPIETAKDVIGKIRDRLLEVAKEKPETILTSALIIVDGHGGKTMLFLVDKNAKDLIVELKRLAGRGELLEKSYLTELMRGVNT